MNPSKARRYKNCMTKLTYYVVGKFSTLERQSEDPSESSSEAKPNELSKFLSTCLRQERQELQESSDEQDLLVQYPASKMLMFLPILPLYEVACVFWLSENPKLCGYHKWEL